MTPDPLPLPDEAVEAALHAWFGRIGEPLCIANYKLAHTASGRELPDRMRAALKAAAQVAGAGREDGERYRWLRDPENVAHEAWETVMRLDVTGEQMDAAIDAARSQERGE